MIKTILLIYITLISLVWAYAYEIYPKALAQLDKGVRAALGHHLEGILRFVKKCSRSHIWMSAIMANMIIDKYYDAVWHDVFSIFLYLSATIPLTSGAIYSMQRAIDLEDDRDRLNSVLRKLLVRE